MRSALISALMTMTALTALAQSPAEALKAGRQQIAAGDCIGAVATLQNAIPAAVALQPEKTRDDALSALHFYTALAFSNCNLPAKAKEELREFFRFHHGAGSLDPKAYPAEFAKLFDEVNATAVGTTSGPTSFDHYYPRFNEYIDAPRRLALPMWAGSTEFNLLADDAERAQWARLPDDDARSGFITQFWQRRDPDPDTPENAYRDEILRRIAFADRAFGDEILRGSLSDRGKVFVLLGVPARVYVSPFTRRDGAFIGRGSRLAFDGTLERWIYFRAQLPAGVPATQVEYRFVTQQGYGDHVMEKDFWPLKALAAAKETRR